MTLTKYTLTRKVAVIHAIKCNKARNFNEATQSSNKLSDLTKEIYDANDSDLLKINSSIDIWSIQSPIANEMEIERLMNRIINA
ncbi:hypothetical protein [Algoriphagus aquimarinus]|uniref:Uncharacterized protein n=1 Tax=Algoriphagus aquimarinus TaxID=237018 RepID=A0A5C7B0I1_9BACT|nr:hypothetical protein [Algoriphagus aquimarinus]TXE13473.1 hypothetical protein ESV85_05730 [Algoriphagus aquimarinus]